MPTLDIWVYVITSPDSFSSTSSIFKRSYKLALLLYSLHLKNITIALFTLCVFFSFTRRCSPIFKAHSSIGAYISCLYQLQQVIRNLMA